MSVKESIAAQPDLVLEYTDPLEGFKGWLVIHRLSHRLCAGGLRVQPGLSRGVVEQLAATMTLKMRITGIRADGAKSGIDYDPTSAGKRAALSRFLRAIRPHVLDRYSMGPDMNTTMPELESICGELGIPSGKIAVARAQELDEADFRKRLALLDQPLAHATAGRLRSGAGLAAACLATLDHLRIPRHRARVAIQGFGGLASGAAFFLAGARVMVTALADREKSLAAIGGLDLEPLLAQSHDGLIPDNAPSAVYGKRDDILTLPCDILIPAAVEKSVDSRIAAKLRVRAVVCGANLAVTPEAEKILDQRGILLVPDMVAGCGGSLSMQGLFGPRHPPTVQEVLEHVEKRMTAIVGRLLRYGQAEKIPPRQAALRICAATPIMPDSRPYTLSPMEPLPSL